MLDKLFHGFEKVLAGVLLAVISLISIIAVIELCFTIYQDLIDHQSLVMDLDQLFDVFAMFLTVLIAIELMSSIYMYLKDKSVHVEMMLLIAITALTRKVVVLDADAVDAMYLIGLASLLGILIGGYYLVKHRPGYPPNAEGGH
jgi:uncharacterized membrane protein (DUF373 family)